MKYEIEIPGLPAGWRAIAFRAPNYGEHFICLDGKISICYSVQNKVFLIVKKSIPRRIILEETDEVRKVSYGDYYFEGKAICAWLSPVETMGEYKVWREVKE